MKRDKVLPKYTTYELNELAKEHLGALLALYADAYHEGVKTGRRKRIALYRAWNRNCKRLVVCSMVYLSEAQETDLKKNWSR